MSALQPLADQLRPLPLWAQVLAAARVVQRGVLALPAAEAKLAAAALAHLEQVQQCCWRGECDRTAERAVKRGMALRDRRNGRSTRGAQSLREALFWVGDACLAAHAAWDFPVDAAVTNSAHNAVLALAGDARFPGLQVQIVAAAEIDLIGFASSEVRQGTYAAVPEEVRARLLPLQPLAAG